MSKQKRQWCLYIVRCADGSFYTGITNDLERRVLEHNSGVGAKYTRGRRPVMLAYSEIHDDRSEACKREYAVKRMSRQQKHRLIQAACMSGRSGLTGSSGS
ncbi:MAG: GIY-YIG nuclease family protein [Candidatus Thiodiazotropha sp.]